MCHEYIIREINGVKYLQFLDAYGRVEYEQPLIYESTVEERRNTEIAPILVEVSKKKNR